MVHLPFSTVSSTHSLRFALLYFTSHCCRAMSVCLPISIAHSILFLLLFIHCARNSAKYTHCRCFPSRWKSANRRRKKKMLHRHTIIVCARCDLLKCRQWKFITWNRYLVIQWWYDWHSNDERIPQCVCDHLMISPILFTRCALVSYLYHHHHFQPLNAIFRVNWTNEEVKNLSILLWATKIGH